LNEFTKNFVITSAAVAAGGVIAWLAGVPVPFLLGASVATAIVAFVGWEVRLPEPVRMFAFFALGIQAGSGVNPAALGQVWLWPASFAALLAAVAATIVATYFYLIKMQHWRCQTAFFAALPGALTFVLAAARETSADYGAVTTLQTVRLLLIIGLIVPLISVLEGGAAIVPVVAPPSDALRQFSLLLAAGLLGAAAGHYSKLPGGMMLGALLSTALLFGTASVNVQPPSAIANVGMIVLGMVIGGRFSGLGVDEVRKLARASSIAFFLGTAAAALIGYILHLATGIGLSKIAQAFVPGGMESMTTLHDSAFFAWLSGSFPEFCPECDGSGWLVCDPVADCVEAGSEP
jgi:uncharacterized protein